LFLSISILFFFLIIPSHPRSTFFPYTTLFRSLGDVQIFHAGTKRDDSEVKTAGGRVLAVTALGATLEAARARAYEAVSRIHFEKDRKSTRLNSSHDQISYAVFCLKKKTKKKKE